MAKNNEHESDLLKTSINALITSQDMLRYAKATAEQQGITGEELTRETAKIYVDLVQMYMLPDELRDYCSFSTVDSTTDLSGLFDFIDREPLRKTSSGEQSRTVVCSYSGDEEPSMKDKFMSDKQWAQKKMKARENLILLKPGYSLKNKF